MSFGKYSSTAFARNPAHAEAFAQAVSIPPLRQLHFSEECGESGASR